MAKTIKITEDGFVWRLLTLEQAKAFFNADIDSLYALFEDDTESLIHDIEEIDEYNSKDYVVEFGVEVGFTNYKSLGKLEQLIKQHDFTYERSDDHRAYKAGLANLKEIMEAKAWVSQKDYVSLWNKYAPTGLKFN